VPQGGTNATGRAFWGEQQDEVSAVKSLRLPSRAAQEENVTKESLQVVWP